MLSWAVVFFIIAIIALSSGLPALRALLQVLRKHFVAHVGG